MNFKLELRSHEVRSRMLEVLKLEVRSRKHPEKIASLTLHR